MVDRFAVPADLLPSTPQEFELEQFAAAKKLQSQPPMQEPGPWIDISGRQADYSNYQLSGDTEFGDYTRGFGKGLVDIVGALLGVAETTGVVKPGTLTGTTDRLANEIVQNMTPSARANLERKWGDLGPEGVLQNYKAAIQQLTTVAPSVMASLIPAAGAAAWAGRGAKALEGTAKTAALARAANIGTATGIGSEALQIAGATYNEIRTTMDGMTHEQLLASPHYKRAFNKHGDEAEARQEVMLSASRGPAALNAIWGGLVAAFPARLAAKYGTGTRFEGTRAQRAAKGFGIEAAEEVSQEVPAALITGGAIQENIDPSYDPTEGLGEKALASFFLGGGIGGILGAATRGRTPPATKDVPDDVRAAVEAQVTPGAEPTPEEWKPGAPPFTPDMGQINYEPGLEQAPNYQPPPPPLPVGPPVPEGGVQQDWVGHLSPQNNIPEPIADIEAQVAQMLDPRTTKQAVYIDPTLTNLEEYERELTGLIADVQNLLAEPGVKTRYPDFGVAVDPHGGLVMATSQALVDEYLAAGATEAARAKLLNYEQAKDSLKTPDKTLTISKLNSDGSVVESQVIDAENNDALTNAQLKYHFDLQPGQRVTVEPTGINLQKRMEQLNLPFNPLGDMKYQGKQTLREQPPTRQAPRAIPPAQPGTEEMNLERALQTAGELAVDKAARIEGKMLKEVAEQDTNRRYPPDTEKDIKLFNQFKELWGKQQYQEPQPDMFGEDIEAMLDTAAAINDPKQGAKRDALITINKAVLGGQGDYDAIENFIANKTLPKRTTPLPDTALTEEAQEKLEKQRRQEGAQRRRAVQERLKKAKRQKKAVRPLRAKLAAEERAAQKPLGDEDQLPLRFSEPKQALKGKAKVKQTAAERRKRAKERWANRQADGTIDQNPDMKYMAFRKHVLDAIHNVLMNTFGLSKKQASAFELADRHLNLSFTLGGMTAAQPGDTRTQFQRETDKLQEAMESGDDAAVLQYLEGRGLDAIAKVLVAGELKIREGKAFALVKRWRNGAKVDLPDTLLAKLEKLYNRDVEGALSELIAEQKKDDKARGVKQEGVAVKGGTVEGVTNIAGEVIDINYVPEKGELVGGKGGKSKNKGEKSPSRQKTAVEAEIDRVLGAADAGAVAPGLDVEREGSNVSLVGQPRNPESIIYPDGGTPASIPDSVFEERFPRLDEVQRDGVRVLWHRIKENWDKGTRSILGDGTGVGKTVEMLTLARVFIDEFTTQKGKSPRVLVVAPSVKVYRNFKKDAETLLPGLFKTDEVGGSNRKTPVIEGLDYVSYSQLNKKVGEQYDLIIYDEAQNIGRDNTWHKHHLKINSPHILYTTATPGDKETSLTLLAATENKTLQEMLREITPEVQVRKDSTGDEAIDLTTVPDRAAFFKALAAKVKALANKYGYIRREYPRKAEIRKKTVEDFGDYKVTLSDGSRVTPYEAEEMLIKYLNRVGADQTNYSQVWAASIKLAELAKMKEITARVDKALSEERQVVVLFDVRQKKEDSTITLSEKDGKKITLQIPIALLELEKQLRAKYGNKVTAAHGGVNQGTVKTRLEKFQLPSEETRVLLATYESVGAGLNLDANIPEEAGGWGRELILATDPWGVDVLDQALGRVERRSTAITPIVTRLFSPFLGDEARAEKLQYKKDLQDAMRGEVSDRLFSMQKNIRVTELPGDMVAVRLYGLPQGNGSLHQKLERLIAKKRKRFAPPQQEHLLNTADWDQIKGHIAEALDIASGVQTAPDENPAPVQAEKTKAPKPEKKAKAPKPAKTTVKKVVEASERADDSPDLSLLTDSQLNQLEETLQKKAGTANGVEFEAIDSTLNDVYREMERRAADLQSLGTTQDSPFGGPVREALVATMLQNKAPSAQQLLKRLAYAKTTSPAQREFLIKLSKYIGRTGMSIVDREGMKAAGYHSAAGLYSQRTDSILLLDEDATPETIVHESLHAVMHYAIDNDPRVRAEIVRLMNEAGKHFLSLSGTLKLTEGQIRQWQAAFDDPHEFVSYGLTNKSINKLLTDAIDPQKPDVSLMRRVLDTLLRFLRIKAPARRRTVAESLEKLVMANMSARRKVDSGTYEMLSEKLGPVTTNALQPLVSAIEARNPPETVGQARAALRRKALGFTTLRQIEKIYKHVLDKLPVGNPLTNYLKAMHGKEVTQKMMATLGKEMYQEYADAINKDDGAHRQTIETLIGDSTFFGVWVNKPLDHKDNAHLDAEGKAEWARLNALYKSDKTAKDIYDRLLNYYLNEREQNFKLRIRNIFDGLTEAGTDIFYVDENDVETAITGNDFAVVADALYKKNKVYDPKQFIARDKDAETGEVKDVSEMLTTAIQNDMAATLQEGPYFPLKRFGDWVVSAYRGEVTKTAVVTRDESDKINAKAERKVNKDNNTVKSQWQGKEWRAYSDLVAQNTQKVLRKKLSEKYTKHWGKQRGVERDPIAFDGDTATQVSRQRWVSMHESEAKALAAREAVIDDGWEVAKDKDGNRHSVTRKIAVAGNRTSTNSQLVNHLRSKLQLSQGQNHPVLAALEASIIDLMPETAVQKSMLNRKGIYGYDNDHGRALAAHVQSASWYRATLEHGHEISAAISGLTTAENTLKETITDQDRATMAGDVLKELRNHVNMESNQGEMRPIIQKIGQFGFLWMLVSPAYVFVNLTQPMMFTLPWLKARQNGGIPAWRAFRNAYAAITPEIWQRAGLAAKQGATKFDIDGELFDFLQRGANGEATLSLIIQDRIDKAVEAGKLSKDHSDGLKTMLEELSKNNVLDFTLALDTSAAAQGRPDSNRFMDVARIMPHLSEVLNRSVTAIAAYEMGRSQGMEHTQATEFATDAVTETQFDYTLLNKPRYMSERYYALAKPIFMFMQHPQHVYSLFIHTALTGGRYAKLKRSGKFESDNPEHVALEQEWKERRDTVIGILKMHLLMGGMTAAMFEPVKWALGLALMISEAISGEPPEETEVYTRRFLHRMLGEDFGEIAADGLPALLGMHFSDQLSISNLAAMKTPMSYSSGRRGVEEMFMSFMGPIPNIAANAAQGVSDLKEGDTLGFLSKITPRLLREPIKTYGLATNGLTDSNGHVIVDSKDMNPLELAWSTLGLRTRKVARAYEKKAVLDNVKNFHRLRQKRLTERLYRARGDAEETAKVQRDIMKYNATLPFEARKVPLTISAHKAKSQQALSELGAVLSPNERWIEEAYYE